MISRLCCYALGVSGQARLRAPPEFTVPTGRCLPHPPSPPRFWPRRLRGGGSAPRRGRLSTISVSTKCIFAVAAWRFDNPHQKVVPRSRISRSTSPFSYSPSPLDGKAPVEPERLLHEDGQVPAGAGRRRQGRRRQEYPTRTPSRLGATYVRA